MEKSLLDLAVNLMKKKKKPQNIYKFLNELAEIRGLDINDPVIMSKMYTDITTSSMFVYCGDDEESKEKDRWDLKHNHPLSLFDKEGSYFNSAEDKARAKEELKADKAKMDAERESYEKIDLDDFDDEDDDIEIDDIVEDSDTDSNEEDVDLNDYDDYDYEESYSEEEYEDMMDDYEDMMD